MNSLNRLYHKIALWNKNSHDSDFNQYTFAIKKINLHKFLMYIMLTFKITVKDMRSKIVGL